MKYTPPLLEIWSSERNNDQQIKSISQSIITRTANIHEHSFTCHKGPNGKVGCRLCKKSGFSLYTGPVELDKESIEEEVPRVLENIQPPKNFHRSIQKVRQ